MDSEILCDSPKIELYEGDCLEILRSLESDLVDSVITDPPYELWSGKRGGKGFMGKAWDGTGIAFSVDLWREVLRVLKPGGHLLSFGGTRTQHRMVCAIEDAGFEIRDCIQWIYGSGFPKSRDVSKAIDSEAGVEREVVGLGKDISHIDRGDSNIEEQVTYSTDSSFSAKGLNVITAPATPEAKQWDGWGTALKPANEPICVARKPLSEKTVAANVLKWGTGGINIDGNRVGTRKNNPQIMGDKKTSRCYGKIDVGGGKVYDKGRWPSNVILSEEAGAMLDEQSGVLTSGSGIKNPRNGAKSTFRVSVQDEGYYSTGDTGGASRFFYCAKASKSERGEENTHPTVKPLKLMEYLVRLVTPPDGLILDPFCGSGTTGVAAYKLNRNCTMIELEPKYCDIIRKRMDVIVRQRRMFA